MKKASKISLKIIFSLLIALFSLQVYAGEKSVGLRAGYITKNDAPTAGLFFKYSFSDHFRMATTFDYYFRHNNTDAYSININGEMPFSIIGNKLAVFPLVGFGLTSWNVKYPAGTGSSDDTTTRKTRMGLNIGAGIDYKVTSTLKLGLELKYGWIKHYSGEAISLSIGYLF